MVKSKLILLSLVLEIKPESELLEGAVQRNETAVLHSGDNPTA